MYIRRKDFFLQIFFIYCNYNEYFDFLNTVNPDTAYNFKKNCEIYVKEDLHKKFLDCCLD